MPSRSEPTIGASGDVDPQTFREHGYRVIDWITAYLESVGELPVLSRSRPGDVLAALPAEGPDEGEPFGRILDDLDGILLPGITHWNHPRFFAYFAISGSAPGILADAIAAALNVNAMLWRTSPSATELEQRVLAWLASWLGLPGDTFGIITDTASISSLCALAAAREAVPDLEVRRRGLAGRPEVPRLRLYVSDQAHSSVEKSALLLGIGQEGVRKVRSDAAYRLDVQALRRAIAEDRADGWLPFAVGATAGTTSTTSVDPIAALADVCEREEMWLHVDAAYAGSAALLPEKRDLFGGWERADSVVVNPHKWLFTPVDCSVLYTRRPTVLERAFSLVPEYLRSDVGSGPGGSGVPRERRDSGDSVEPGGSGGPGGSGSLAAAGGPRGSRISSASGDPGDGEAPVDFMNYGIQLGRRFRALKLWMIFRTFGRRGLEQRLRSHIEMAGAVAARIDAHPDFERLAPTPFSTVCFRHRPGAGTGSGDGTDLEETDADDWAADNERLLEAVNASGRAFLSHTRLRGRFAIRLAIGNLRTTAGDVEATWELIEETARRRST